MTVREIYDMAICLMGEQSEFNGATMTNENMDYIYRTIPILNTAIAALSTHYSAYFTGETDFTGRPVAPGIAMTKKDGETDYGNPDFEQEIRMDDEFAAAVLPKYLGAQLLAPEDPELAAFLMTQYRETLQEMKGKIRCSFEPIAAPYGLF